MPLSTASSPDIAGLRRLISLGSTINLKVKHRGSLNSQATPLQYSMVLLYSAGSPILANRGWRWGWTPDPRQIGDGGGDGPPIPGKSDGDGTAVPDPRQIGDGGGDGDRGFRALGGGGASRPLQPVPSQGGSLTSSPAAPCVHSDPKVVRSLGWRPGRYRAATTRPRAARLFPATIYI